MSDPIPLTDADVAALAVTVSNGKPVILSRLSKVDALAVLCMAGAIIARRRALGLPVPSPARRAVLPADRREAMLRELGITPGEIVAGIFEEPLMQAVLALMVAVAGMAMIPTPAARSPGSRGPR